MSKANTESESCQLILESAETLVRQKGFGASTIDEICKTAGVTKGAFFHYFKSKKALGLEILSRMERDMCSSPACCPESAPKDSLERVMYAIDCMEQASMDPTSKCSFIGVFAQEMCSTENEISQKCLRICSMAIENFQAIFQAAKDDYAADRDIDVAAMTKTLFALRQGAAVMSKAQGSTDVIPQVFSSFKSMVQCLFKPTD